MPPIVPTPPRPGPSPTAPSPSSAPSVNFDPDQAAAAGSYSGAAGIFTIDDIAQRSVTLFSVATRTPNDTAGLPAKQRPWLERANDLPPRRSVAGQMTVQDAMKYFVNMAYTGQKDKEGHSMWGNMQIALYQMGLYGDRKPGEVLTQTWNGVTDADALEKAIRGYLQVADQDNGAGLPVSFEEYINKAVLGRKSAAEASKTLEPKDPFINEQADPRQIAAAVQQAAQSTLGRNLSNEEIQHFVSEFHAAQTAFNKQKFTALHDTTGKQFNLTAPDLESGAENYVEQGHGTEAAAQDLGDYVNAIQQLLGTS